jgi:YHS domain-containing protein
LTDDQVAVLQWWVDAGASADKKVAELDPPLEVSDAIAASLGLPAAGAPAGPAPFEQIAPQVAAASAATGAVITRVAPDQPWLSVNAAVARSFGDAELAKLGPLARNITWLNLAFTKVSDTGLVTVADMSNLERLRLERTGVGDAALVHLSKLRKLEYLNLYATNVTDAGLKPLAGLPSLRQLYLWKTKVTPMAARAFAAAKGNPLKVDRIKQQIAALQSQLEAQNVEVVGGVQAPAPAPAAAVAKAGPTSAPATAVASAAPAVATNAAAAPVAINKTCPVTGKPIDPTKFVDYKGKRIAFCCSDCPAEFLKHPEKYADKLALATADKPAK